MKTTIKIREWEDMEREFGLTQLGNIDCTYKFTDNMKYLCGNIYEVELDDDGDTDIDDWTISKDMYTIQTKNKKSGENMKTTIKIREWEEMEEEFGLDEAGDIECSIIFLRRMEYLCGNIYEVELDSDGDARIDDWYINKDAYNTIDERNVRDMRLSDLKTGMVVEYENKDGDMERRMIVDDILMGNDVYYQKWSADYNDDLTNKYNEMFDIERVYQGLRTFDDLYSDNLDLIWERKWIPKIGEMYWTIDFSREEYVVDWEWLDDGTDAIGYEAGVIFETEEEAMEVAKKMLEVVKNR